MRTEPLLPTREQALAAPGLVYLHWKGGVYRALIYVHEAEPLPDTAALTQTWEGGRPTEPLVVYEHLWPHAHQYYVRPAAEFYDHEARPAYNGEGGRFAKEGQMDRRFTPYEGGRVAVHRLAGGFDHECMRSR